MTIRVHNDLTGKKEDFVPLRPGRVTFYLCGPTVYGRAHIGNLRTFVSFDVIRRYLRYRGHEVTFVRNVTDVDDRMIKRSQERGITIDELATQYIELFETDQRSLNILPPEVAPRATAHVPEIIGLIERLLQKGLAYEADGDVYFSIEAYPEYGQLTRQSLDEMQAGARVEVNERKRHPLDFALWKRQKPGEPAWNSPWGPGRPGWHIECSAMAMKYLGDTLDIHAGGIDLLFPHHENELAQSSGVTGKPFARYWLHGAFLNFEGEKMSKSLGNVFDLGELSRRYDPEVLRFFYLSVHYRSPLSLSDELLQSARSALERLKNLQDNLRYQVEHGALQQVTPDEADLLSRLGEYRRRFIEQMDDDFNSAAALAVIFQLTREVNLLVARGGSAELARGVLALFDEWAGVLGVLQTGPNPITDAEVEALVTRRQEARRAKNWSEADRIRDRLAAQGIVLEDTPQGVRYKRK